MPRDERDAEEGEQAISVPLAWQRGSTARWSANCLMSDGARTRLNQSIGELLTDGRTSRKRAGRVPVAVGLITIVVVSITFWATIWGAVWFAARVIG